MNDMEERIEAAEKKLEVLQACMDDVKQEIEELKEANAHGEIPDCPEFGNLERCYSMDSNFDVIEDQHGGGKGSDIFGEDALFLNDFHTEAYAEEFAEKCKLIAALLHCKWYLCPDYVPDFKSNREEKYYVYYDVCCAKYMTHWRYVTINNEVYFDTKENAQKAADWLNGRTKHEEQ